MRSLEKPSLIKSNVITETGIEAATPLPREVRLDLQPFTSGRKWADPSWVVDTVAYKSPS
jgi:hypothetical protein